MFAHKGFLSIMYTRSQIVFKTCIVFEFMVAIRNMILAQSYMINNSPNNNLFRPLTVVVLHFAFVAIGSS